MSHLEFRPIRVATGSEDEGGVLALVDGRLCAVLVRLDAAFNGPAQGHWHLEAGFGAIDTRPDSFTDLADAAYWIGQRLGLAPADLDGAVATAPA